MTDRCTFVVTKTTHAGEIVRSCTVRGDTSHDAIAEFGNDLNKWVDIKRRISEDNSEYELADGSILLITLVSTELRTAGGRGEDG